MFEARFQLGKSIRIFEGRKELKKDHSESLAVIAPQLPRGVKARPPDPIEFRVRGYFRQDFSDKLANVPMGIEPDYAAVLFDLLRILTDLNCEVDKRHYNADSADEVTKVTKVFKHSFFPVKVYSCANAHAHDSMVAYLGG